MGEVIPLGAGRQRRHHGRRPVRARARTTLYFDLVSPATYLAAERVNRLFGQLDWRPALRDALHGGDPVADAAARERDELAAAARASVLRLPLVWPDGASSARAAMRVASLACERGRGGAFVLAASRLAFCGGFDLDDPEVLAEAAAAAGLGLPEVLAAAGDRSRDGEMEATALRLLAQGANRLPVLRVGRTLFCGEHRIAEAAAAVRRRPRAESSPTQVPHAG
jgi:2-hydroxychromene-2-carboxylate isomerase